MDIDSFVLSVNTKHFIKDVKSFVDLFDFSNLSENDELFSEQKQQECGKFIIETPKNCRVDEYIYLRRKMYGFKCGNDSKKVERFLQL